MAQDTFRPVRSDDSYPGDPAPSSAGRPNDPLAELARLIGKEDPFAALGRQGAPASSRAPAAQPHPGDPDAGAGPYEPSPDPHQPYAAGYDDAQYQRDPRYDEPQYETDGQQPYASDAYYEDGQSYGEEGYDEAPPEKRRGGLMTVAAVLGLAILATGAFFGYRAWTSPSSGSGEPPVIKAEQAPTKVIPAAPSSDSQLVKTYDRVGDRGGEKVVPREEQPVDPKSTLRAPPPGGTGTAASTGSVLPPLAAATQPITAAAGEPKKVKTFAYRPDQPTAVPSAAPQVRATNVAPPAPPAASTPTRMANAPTQSAPVQAVSTGGESGSYVQVSSQLSEADAQASFRALQAKYPSQLGDQRAVIRRVDLSDKGIGIRYRAMVGPFSTGSEAKQFCENFKAAGGKCVYLTN